MKKVLRSALFASLSFLVLAYLYPGFKFVDTQSVVLATVGFSFIYLFVRPILKIFSIPLNLLTFGLFSLFINVILLYLLSVVVPGFEIVPFQFAGAEISGFHLPAVYLNVFVSALVASLALSFLNSLLFWIFY